MNIGIVTETKDHEFRVGLTADSARRLVEAGHRVLVEKGAGLGSGIPDSAYDVIGAELVEKEEAWAAPDLIVKVKEPSPSEVSRLHSGQILFTYLHLAAARDLTLSLIESDAIAIGYETIRNLDGSFPVLAPMSEVAGRLAVQIGATLLHKSRGGKGLLVGGVPGVMRGKVTIIGGGIVGINSLRIAHALGAEVDLLDIDLKRLAYIDDLFHGELNTLYSNRGNIERSVLGSDLLIGAVYLSGRRAPILVEEGLISAMEAGSVVVDVAVDQGGCIETIHPTTHSDPTYVLHEVIHYGVTNMPGAVPRTSTAALNNTTLPFVENIAANGIKDAVQNDPALAQGVNVWKGEVTCEGVAESLQLPYKPLPDLL